MIVEKLYGVFKPGEVLTILEVADRSGYGLSTVSCYLPKMVYKKMLWRVAWGKYSLDPKPADVFNDQEAILKAVDGLSYWTSRFAREATGLTVKEFTIAMYRLQLRGVVKPIRKGVYAVFKHPREGVMP